MAVFAHFPYLDQEERTERLQHQRQERNIMATEPPSHFEHATDRSVEHAKSSTDREEPYLVLHLRHGHSVATRYERFGKPVFDRIVGTVLFVLWLPFLMVLVIGVWLSMGRPALYKQRRVGRNGGTFTIYKLRTMRPDRRLKESPWDGPERRKVHKSRNDPRITRFGRFLRNTSLDETPQFLNVVLGQMSLVGPRPELVEIVEEKYELWQHARHVVRPGVTGLWQISEQRQALMYRATDIDLRYLDRISLKEDLRILALTLPAVLGRRSSL